MSNAFPFIRVAPQDVATHVVAYRHGVAITAAAFLRDVHAVSAHLPDTRYCLNVCGDRYHITVLLAAAMLKGMTSLLPPNTARETLRQLRAQYQDVCVIADHSDNFENAISIARLIETGFAGETPIPFFAATELVGILFTSGSTGAPQPNARTWGSLCSGVIAEAAALKLPASSTIIGTVPAQHSYGLESTLALALQNGHALSADHSFYPADVGTALACVPPPRVLVTTPFHLRLLIESEEQFPEIDLIVSATAPLSPQLAAQAEARFGVAVREIYGCTEAGQVASRRTTEGDLWTLFPGVNLAQRDQQVWVGGGHVGEARELHDAIEPVDATTFRLHGRSGDMINIVGKRTSLAHLNFQLNSIAGVDDGIFVAPQEDGDSKVPRMAAFVVSKTLTAERIMSALRERVDAVFLPRPLHIVDQLPRNATGKIVQSELNEIVRAVRT
jgi:acyl-coenzyme A synthetase/AMP-(fatty) acid ligase